MQEPVYRTKGDYRPRQKERFEAAPTVVLTADEQALVTEAAGLLAPIFSAAAHNGTALRNRMHSRVSFRLAAAAPSPHANLPDVARRLAEEKSPYVPLPAARRLEARSKPAAELYSAAIGVVAALSQSRHVRNDAETMRQITQQAIYEAAVQSDMPIVKSKVRVAAPSNG